MRSPSNTSFRVSARAHRMVLRVSQPASGRTSLRSRSKQRACTSCREITDSISALTTGPRITCRRRSRLTPSLIPSSLLTFNVVSSAHASSQSGPGPKHNERNHR
jgi:hypothetical protein